MKMKYTVFKCVLCNFVTPTGFIFSFTVGHCLWTHQQSQYYTAQRHKLFCLFHQNTPDGLKNVSHTSCKHQWNLYFMSDKFLYDGLFLKAWWSYNTYACKSMSYLQFIGLELWKISEIRKQIWAQARTSFYFLNLSSQLGLLNFLKI